MQEDVVGGTLISLQRNQIRSAERSVGGVSDGFLRSPDITHAVCSATKIS